MQRLNVWRKLAIGVKGQPNWIFIKLHCHSMDRADHEAVGGELKRRFLKEITSAAAEDRGLSLHFTTAREMVNLALAACDGRDGDPGQFRDYKLRLNC